MTNRYCVINPAKVKGVSLVEVLCAAIVIGAGIGVVMRSHINSLVALQYAQQYTIATNYAHDLAEMIRSNPIGSRCFVANNTDCTPLEAPEGESLTDVQNLQNQFVNLAIADYQQWVDDAPDNLPGMQATSVREGDNTIRITVSWVSGKDDSDDNADTYTITVTTNPSIADFTLSNS